MKPFSRDLIKKIILVIVVVPAWLFAGGCIRYAAKHPEKSHDAYLKDKAYCEKQARDYVRLISDQVRHSDDQTSYTDEVGYVRQCMKERGWKYGLRMGE